MAGLFAVQNLRKFVSDIIEYKVAYLKYIIFIGRLDENNITLSLAR